MYKIITHNITEEHFDHPMAANIAKVVKKNTNLKATMQSESVVALRNNVSRTLNTFNRHLRQFVLSATTGDGLDINSVQAYITADINSMASTILVPYFSVGGTPAPNLSTLQAVVNTIYSIATTAKAGGDLAALNSTLSTQISALSTYMDGLNPNYWSVGQLNAYWTAYFNAIVTQITSRLSKNWNADLQSEANAYDVIIANGIPPTMGPGASFLYYLTNGIIQLNPSAFTF